MAYGDLRPQGEPLAQTTNRGPRRLRSYVAEQQAQHLAHQSPQQNAQQVTSDHLGDHAAPPQQHAEAAAKAARPRAPATTTRRRAITGAIWSGIAGFVLGAVFWHLVGFWSFVSHVVFKGPTPDAPPRAVETGSLPPTRRDAPRALVKPATTVAAGEARDTAATAAPAATAGAGACVVSMDRAGRPVRTPGCTDRQLPTLTGRTDGKAAREEQAAPVTEAATSASWTVQVDAGDAAAAGR